MSLLLKLFGIVLLFFFAVLGLSVVEFIKWVNTDDAEYVSNTEFENLTTANIESKAQKTILCQETQARQTE